MWDILTRLFDASGFPPRWHCGTWSRELGWLHILSDLGVWSAYVAIPCVLVYFAWRKQSLPFRNLFWLFGAFILACGTTHLMEAIIFVWPGYRLAGVIKLFTAVVSWTTVLSLIPVVPQALALRTPAELDLEINERRRAEDELRQMQATLERRVEERTWELTRTNAALRRSEERYRVLVKALSQIVWITQPDGQVAVDSPSWRAFTGQSQEDWLGSGWVNAVHPDDRERALADWNRAVESQSNYSTEYRLRNTAGEYRHTEARGVPVRDADGNVMEWIGVNLDVTEQRAATTALRDADRRKDQFLAMLGHELRNPLCGISGAAQILAQLGLHDPDAREMQEIIERQAGHMTRMIDDLLEVSRISRGKIQIQPRRIDLKEHVRQAFAEFRPTFTTGRLQADLQLPEAPVWADCDATRLGQILVNLFQNAAKFTDPGGAVTVAVTIAPDGRDAVISVRDTGIGLSKELLSQIFEPFTQGDSSLGRSRGGLGLGLALVKGLIELHGGRVTARSAGEGQGAEFAVAFPLATMPNEDGSSAQTTSQKTSQLRILIVEDQRDVSFPLRRMLERDGHRVDLAEDGKAALELARSNRPQVVLCDIGLPGGMDGWEVARALRQDDKTHAAVLIAVTGYGREEDRARGMQAGFDHYLTKPVNYAALSSLFAPRVPDHEPL